MSPPYSEFKRLARPLHRRIMHMVSRAKLSLVDDGQGLQRVQVEALDGETRDNVERFEQFGFSSHPPAGAEAIMVSIGGSRDHPVIIAVDDRKSRPRGRKAGEAEVYNAAGVSILLQADGKILVKAPGRTVRIEGDLEVTGEVRDRCDGAGRTMAEMRDVYNRHRHPETSLPTEKI